MIELEDLRRKNEMILQLQAEYQRENRELEQGLREVHTSIQNIKTGNGNKIECPTLEKLLAVGIFIPISCLIFKSNCLAHTVL
jgi:hypothetical protein